MKRRIVSLFFVVCLLISCAACKIVDDLPIEPNEQELSVFELTLSDEIKAQIDEAWNNSVYAADSGSHRPMGISWVCMEDGYIYASYGNARYYGTFGDSVVWFAEGAGTTGEDTDFILSGIRFYFNGSCHFYVYTDGSLCEMVEAYENGLLTDADVAMIAQRHKEYQHNSGGRRIDLDDEDGSVFDLHMPEQLKQQISRHLVAAGYVEEAIWAEFKDGMVFSDGIRFYGQNASDLILFVPLAGDEPVSFWLGPGSFKHPTAGVLLRYSEGRFEDLREYYENFGYRSYGNRCMNRLASCHKEFNQVLYPELYS